MFKLVKKRLSKGAVLAAVFFLFIQVICDLNLPALTSDMINNGVAKGDTAYIWKIGLQMLLIAAVGLVAAVGNVYFASTQAQKTGAKLREAVFRKVLQFSGREIDQFGTSSLITRTTNDILQIQNVLIMLLRMMLMAPLMLIGASFMAYQSEKRLTGVFLVSIPLLLVAIAVIMYFAVPLFKGLQKKIDRINLTFREGLTGVRVIRAFRRDDFEQKRFADANKDYTSTGIKVFSIVSLMFPIMTLILSGTNMGIVWFGAKLIGDQEMGVGNLVSFMTYASMILFSFMMLSMVFVFIPRGQAAAARINEVLEMPLSIVETTGDQVIDQNKQSHLVFDNVSFRYENAENLALKNVSFSAKAGQMLAVIGGTGSGKSTLVNLIPRLYDPTAGQIILNETPIAQVAQSDLHEHVSFVQQKAVLFKGTIRSNLQFGNETATDEELWHALELAQAKEFVSELPDGLDAQVEQGGDNFSGGQKQRLAIARALMKKAAVYVFDDSFSALDFKTDAKLREGLKNDPEIQKSVLVIVAQRVSTVTAADEIIVLDEGKVVGQGTHDELVENNETYQEIVESQLKKGDEH
ncbi:ABC transporter ATP-binding protein [Ligilactobacillus murinus]|uniref:ABC transporter ATP-binding protein n=1 Tax=Ligilactobacillus murinus TaxID=1622 RepID=A0A4Q2ABD7_9LACO|nr:ABC transporter ATP-binding protein [Ligilactobacillus murinus]NBH86600.1 ABC transporter ATP-binding protein [Lachnospiraceae bacterium]HCM78395.1 ABC transporter ATP-binding protein [Lactobacillus sp.]AWZ37493.1 ABC transporter ATP-binding protein [Ligilactobacillus murinus]MCZ0673873.1 ABC transporter ATP-binding protein [Ligilactobacillus murinus]MCZ0694762.1 ABC transporter ATP-binding protein [Ligilactobacillus murinus]